MAKSQATKRQATPVKQFTRRDVPTELPDLSKPQLLTYAEASAVLKISIPTLERMVREGTLPAAPIDRGGVRFRSVDLLNIINGTPATAAPGAA
jgi:excisionase family DNA binding protein